MGFTTPADLQQQLHQALSHLGSLPECVLLDYPDYLNIGDHLIWLGTIFYLTDVSATKIKYIASINSFSAAEMDKNLGDAPILLQGGGNLGDSWQRHQKFREHIINKYRDRPIFILPQSIYFSQPAALQQAAQIFNSHPNLTIFVRDNYSHQIAQQAFHQCRIIKAPDMALQMVGMPGLTTKTSNKKSLLYHCREDSELNPAFSPQQINLPNLTIQDWISYQWIYREKLGDRPEWYWRLPGIIRLIREGWQRGFAHPQAWISRQQWQHWHPYNFKLNSLAHSTWHQKSWSLMHSGIYQFQQYHLVITNRLHGHITCLLLGIPHIFLPNSYHKNEYFYQTWTAEIPFCGFVNDPTQIKVAIEKLL